MLNINPHFWVALAIVATIAIIAAIAYFTGNERTIHIGGIAHTGFLDRDKRSYCYDCTGHGHVVGVWLEEGMLLSDDYGDIQTVSRASKDEQREWIRFFGMDGIKK